MKKILFAALIIGVLLSSCGVTQPGEREYYPQSQTRVYYDPAPYYSYDPYSDPYVYNDRYSRNYDRRYDRRYERRYNRRNNTYNNQYNTRQYPNTTYRREQPRQAPLPQEQKERRLPDGSRVSPDGRITLPNGQVIDKRK